MDTGRRSFLAAALAWLASALALLWPRRALSALAPARARPGFTLPTAPADPGPATYRRVEREVSPDRDYEDLRELLDDMHDHLCRTGHLVLSADDPRPFPVAGWSTFGPDPEDPSRELSIWWKAPVTAVGRLFRDVRAGGPPPNSFCDAAAADPDTVAGQDVIGLMESCFKTAEGRRRLAASYYAGSQERFQRGLGPLPRRTT